MVTAVVLINVDRGELESVARKLSAVTGISEVYSVAGRFDLVAILRLKHHELLASLVADDIQKCPGVLSTETLIAFRAFSKHNLEGIFGIGDF